MSDSENLVPNLSCKEDGSCLQESCDQKNDDFDFCSVSESDSEYVGVLLQKETIFRSNGKSFLERSEGSWLKCARTDAVKWILDTRALLGFHFCTAYLSLIYFDLFFSRRTIANGKSWAIRLLSVACLSLAAKMEEYEVPALSDYHTDEYSFGGNVIQRMEILILNTLEWKMGFATPFTYLNYFIAKFCGGVRHKEVINRAVELILAAMGEINVMEYRPSIIAVAAVLAAYDLHLTEKMLKIKINAVPSWGTAEKEHVLSCYNLMQETRTFQSKTSPNSLSTPSSAIHVLDDSTIRSTVGKKRRLTYTDGDQDCPQPEIPQ